MTSTSSRSHLTGTVEYRLDLGGGGASPSAGTKRPRPTSKGDANVGKNVSWVHNTGYFFIPDGDANGWSDSATPTSQGSTSRRRRDRRGYPIVYPYSCIDTICKAAIAGCRVKITRYDWVNFGNTSIDEEDSDDEHSDDEDDSEMPLASQGTTESSSSFASTSSGGPVAYSAKVLEIRRGGMSFAELDGGMLVGGKHGPSTKQSASKENEESPPMTLSMFAELETKIRSTSKSSGGGGGAQGRSSSERYSVTARIDATSAIIATLPSDPFALVEMYEDAPQGSNEAPLSAVAVLRGRSALAAHVALQPGAMVTFTNVLRQRWHIPKSFEEGKFDAATAARLKNRAPSHVFVVNNGRSIGWCLDDGPGSNLSDSLTKNVERFGQIPPLPSTPMPLVAVQGLVTSVRRASLGAAGEIIHSISIDSLDGQRSKLYLTYYPLSPELIWGIRRGVYIRAINVQPVDGGTWGDCENNCRVLGASIRSTVLILHPARREDEENRLSSTSSNLLLTQAPERPQISATKCKPFTFMNMKLTFDEMEWREQLRAVWYDKSDLESVTDDAFDTIFRNLLAQHEKTTKAEYGASKQKQNEKSKRKRKTKRDAYVEFFYHPCDGDFLLDERPAWPIVTPLIRIRDACVGEVKRLLEKYGNATLPNPANQRQKLVMRSGWTASKCFQKESLSEILVNKKCDESINLYACGVAGSKLLSLRDGSCQLPVCLGICDEDASSSNLTSHLLASCGMNVQSGAIVALPISSVVVSCICLGPKPRDSSPDHGVIQYLPVPTAIDDLTSGSCAIFIAKDLLFIASVHIRWNGPQTIRRSSSGKSKRILITIQESLGGGGPNVDTNITNDTSNIFVAGRLVRHRFGLRKIQHDAYKGCVLTLSHLSLHRDNFNGEGVEEGYANDESCDVQSIELKLTTNNIQGQATRRMRQTIRQLLQRVEEVDSKNHTALVSYSASDDQVGLATAWWFIAEDARYAPLLCGGRDESQTMSGAQFSGVYVRFPLAARETSRHGYRRFQCNLDGVVSFAVGSTKDVVDDSVGRGGFDFVGGEKFLPGMIDRLPERDKAAGERLEPCPPESLSGIPTRTLAQLHWNVCRDISQKTRTATAPSLAIRITDARLLGITFCRARAECTHCYQFLIQRGEKDGEPKEAKSGVVSSVRFSTPTSTSAASKRANDSTDERSFWHLPLGNDCDVPRPDFAQNLPSPSKSASKGTKSPGSSTKSNSKPSVRTNLQCPNECPIDVAAIKWECSGIIDGTGQAKLHAEREAALALLGSGLDVKSVEDGAWAVEGGITYQKSVPPRSFIRNAMREAQMAAQALAREEASQSAHKRKRKVGPQDVLSLLTPEAKGEYTLQRYCRFSKNPMRCVDVVCRCKPMSDKAAEELNRTDVEVTTARCEDGQAAVSADTITYTLPPLKLNLVDLFTVPTVPREDGWRLVQSLER